MLVLMGSGVQAALETVEHLNQQGEKVGLICVRLYRPFSVEHAVLLPCSHLGHPVLGTPREGVEAEGVREAVKLALPVHTQVVVISKGRGHHGRWAVQVLR